MDTLLGRMSDGVELAQQELDELLAACFGDNGQAIDNHKSIEALLEADLKLLSQVGEVDFILVKVVVDGEVIVGGRHGCGVVVE